MQVRPRKEIRLDLRVQMSNRRTNAAVKRAKRKVGEQAHHEKRSEAHAGTQQRSSPQKPESADAGLRVERARRENSRHRLAHRGKIHPARARRAELGRSGGGRELLPARRALFPPDRRRAGTVPPAEPLLQSAAAAGPERQRKARPTTTTTTATTASPSWARTSRATRRSRQRRRRSLICRATRSRFRRATSSSNPPAAAALCAAVGAGRQCAVPDPNALPAFITGGGQPQPNAGSPSQGNGPNGHEQGDRGRIASGIAGAGVIAAAATAPTVRKISAMPIRRAPRRSDTGRRRRRAAPAGLIDSAVPAWRASGISAYVSVMPPLAADERT